MGNKPMGGLYVKPTTTVDRRIRPLEGAQNPALLDESRFCVRDRWRRGLCVRVYHRPIAVEARPVAISMHATRTPP